MSFPTISPYRITRVLGMGGMGVVYEATHEKIERRVAIKVLRPEAARDKELSERFLNEARAVNLVGHPGLVQISDYGHLGDGSPYLVMEFLAGETLSARMQQRGGKLPVKDALCVVRQAAEVLAAAHQKGIIHRDLKPDNVMLVADTQVPEGERVKILDFGIAKLIENAPRSTQAMMGTPHYMAPEQCRDTSAVTGKADVYSMGVMLFELLSGRLPFLDQGMVQQLTNKLLHDAPRLASVAPEVPAAVCALVDGLLSRDVDKRPEMAQLITELSRVESGGGVGFAATLRQHKRAVLLSGSFLFACCFIGILLLSHRATPNGAQPAPVIAAKQPVEAPPPRPPSPSPGVGSTPVVDAVSETNRASPGPRSKRIKKSKVSKQMEYEK